MPEPPPHSGLTSQGSGRWLDAGATLPEPRGVALVELT